MKKLNISFLVVILLAGLTAKAQKSEDWAGFARYNKANEKVMTLPVAKRTVVFMGNSITDFWYNSDSSFFLKNNYIDRGISGQTTSQMLVRFRKDVIDLRPRVVIILAGTNDIAQNTGYISLNNILGNLISMAELAQAHHIKVILCSITPAFDYPWHKGMEPNIKIPEINAMIRDYAKKHKMGYVDYFSALTDGKNGMREGLSKDGVHPTMKGYKIMEGISHSALEKIL